MAESAELVGSRVSVLTDDELVDMLTPPDVDSWRFRKAVVDNVLNAVKTVPRVGEAFSKLRAEMVSRLSPPKVMADVYAKSTFENRYLAILEETPVDHDVIVEFFRPMLVVPTDDMFTLNLCSKNHKTVSKMIFDDQGSYSEIISWVRKSRTSPEQLDVYRAAVKSKLIVAMLALPRLSGCVYVSKFITHWTINHLDVVLEDNSTESIRSNTLVGLSSFCKTYTYFEPNWDVTAKQRLGDYVKPTYIECVKWTLRLSSVMSCHPITIISA